MILSTHTRRPILEEDQHLIITPTSPKQTETINQNNNHHNHVDSNTKMISTAPTIVVSQEQSHSHNNKLDSKKRTSSFLGKYKLFHSTTDDLLKTTPGKLKSFFNNILHYREMHVRLRKKKKSKEERNRQSSSSDLKRRSLIPDENTDVMTLKCNSYEPGSEISSRESSSLSCHGTPTLDRVDGRLKTSAYSTNETCDVAISTHFINATESGNLSPRGYVSDSESDPFSYSSGLTESPRVYEHDAQSTSSSVHSRSSTDGDITDQDLDKSYRRHSSPLHVFEQLRNLRLEKRSATYLVSDNRNSGEGGDVECHHSEELGEKSKVKRTKSPFSFLTRKSSRAKTDPH